MQAIQSRSKRMSAGRLPPREESLSKDDGLVAVDPLAGYTDSTPAAKPPPSMPSSSEVIESITTLDDAAPPSPSAAPLVALSSEILVETGPSQTPSVLSIVVPETTQTSAPKVADTKQVSKKIKMLALAREGALKEAQSKRQRELEQKAERRKAHSQGTTSARSDAKPGVPVPKSGIMSFLKSRGLTS